MPDVPEAFQHAVLFIACRRGAVEPVGTAFYVTNPPSWNPDASPPERIPRDYPGDPERYGWLVTARHVIEGIDRDSDDGKVLLLVNSTNGARVDPPPELSVSDWIQLPNDETTGYLADLALLPFECPDHYMLAPIPVEATLTRSRREHADVTAGVDVVYPSLYHQYAGARRNIPLMRSGTVAAIADYEEPVVIRREQDAQEVFAHLVEARSYPGVSGSPVFVVLPPGRTKQHEDGSGTFMRLRTSTEFYLLGVMITHFGLNDPNDLRELVNLGLAVVLDAGYIWQGIESALAEDRGVRASPSVA